ncbi:transcription factor DIVARICATA-like [Cicer arietinum]|uniref:Transcription factor DIVARICATA-like n=1 Tax=Cicer arietinum TaxID=3827 RepID=A0A1S2XL04_CICAR|nr:transcription factor DIVARICATA-like [Cicer arietinum]
MDLETLYSPYSMLDSNWFVEESYKKEWTKEDNKKFESALAIYDKDTPDRWIKVAEMIPGKTVFDVIKQYRELEEDVCEIEAGNVPLPGYFASSFTFEVVDNHNYDGSRRRALSVRGSDHERKKGVPWTEEEHRRFLMGLLKYGKGDWRNISRNFVVTKTPTQVASHAQKYYIRQKVSGGKDKRRPSIHDITTLSLTQTSSSNKNINPNMSKVQMGWSSSHCNDGSLMAFNPNSDDFTSKSLKIQGQDLYDCSFHEAYAKMKVSGFAATAASRDFNKGAVFGIHAL